jgi:hypothetical protein
MKAGPKASVDDSPLTGRRVGQGYTRRWRYAQSPARRAVARRRSPAVVFTSSPSTRQAHSGQLTETRRR